MKCLAQKLRLAILRGPSPRPMHSPPFHHELTDAKIIRRLLRVGWEYRRRSIAVFLLQAALLLMTMAGLSFTGVAVDVIRHALDPAATPPRWPFGVTLPEGTSPEAALALLSGLVLLAAGIRAVFNYLYSVQVGRLVHLEMVPVFRSRLFTRLQRLSFRFFDANATGPIINRVTRDVQLLRSFVDGVLVQGSVLLLALSFFFSYMLSVHVTLTFVCLALTPLLYVATFLFSRWARPAYRKNRELSDDMVRTMAEGIEGILVTKVFGREPEQKELFEGRSLTVKEQQLTIFRVVSRFAPGIDMLTHLNLLILLLYGGSLVADRSILLGDLVVFAGLLQQFASRASGMSGIVNTLQQSLSGARRVFEVMDSEIEVRSPEHPILPAAEPASLRFENVSFSYADGPPILRGIDLDVPAGACIGILGHTGAGKSTLLSLAARFYDPQEGCLRLDGEDLRRYDVDALRRTMGIVFQESLLFRDTVRNNIAYGKPDATIEEIERAARVAGATEFIERLPHGFDSVVNESGVNLSGGQRQRIAIARALLLQPKVLLFDDPTTAIDPETEKEVLSAIRSASSGRTTLIVSNRLSTLRHTDRIVVLEGGRVAQQGTHSELMKSSVLYRKAANLQGVDERSLDVLRGLGAAQ